MNNLKYKLMNFMQGRYGNDQLNIGLLVLYFVLGIVRMFIRNRVAAYIFYVVMTAVLLFVFYRILSRNIAKRQQENAVFMRFWGKIRPKLILFKDRIRDVKTKRYRTCPNCKNVLRLPVRKGKHFVKCPRCGEEFSVRIL